MIQEVVDLLSFPVIRQNLQHHTPCLLGRQWLLGHRDEVAIHAGADDVTGLDVHVARAALHGLANCLFHLHSVSGGLVDYVAELSPPKITMQVVPDQIQLPGPEVRRSTGDMRQDEHPGRRP